MTSRNRALGLWAHRGAFRFLATLSTAAMVAVGLVVLTQPAAAATPTGPGPVVQPGPTAASAAALPTAQIDGVGLAQAISNNNTVWVTGKFTTVRPAGAAPGQNTSPRSDIMAYDLTTGVAKNFSVNPSLQGKGNAIAVSPDGSRVYVGGEFVNANGQDRYHIAAFDTTTGALIASFAPNIDYIVDAITVTNTAVYVGGSFSNADGLPRAGLAAFSPTDGSLLGWAPTTGIDPSTTNTTSQVMGLAMSTDGTKLVVAGSFGMLNGVQTRGIGAVDATTGATITSWNIQNTVYSTGDNAAIYSLSTDGKKIFGTAYNYYGVGNIEGTFAIDGTSGQVAWVEDCHGDTYDSFAVNGYVYTVSHAHYCGNIGGFPQPDPWWFHRALAFTDTATGVMTADPHGYTNWAGFPSPSLVNWFPDLEGGSYTGLDQAAWSVTGNSQYLVLAGEFPSAENTPQQGLVRYALKSANAGMAPEKSGGDIAASAIQIATGVRVSMPGDWDEDDLNLTYSLFKNGNTTTPIYTATLPSTFWNMPTPTYVDTATTAGVKAGYRWKVTDPNGNAVWGNGADFTPTSNGSAAGPYPAAVAADGATGFWPLNEGTPGVAYDNVGANDMDEQSGVTPAATGPFAGSGAASFDGFNAGFTATRTAVPGPNVFSVSAWFSTTSSTGGKIVGFGDSRTGTSSNYDRHIFMDAAGHVVFGVYNNATYTVTTANTYNDGTWHQAVGTMSSDGVKLYVDGKLVGANTGTNVAQPYTGYWRVGGDSSWGGASFFTGSIAAVAVYPKALTPAQVSSEWMAAGRTATVPTDSYGTTVVGDSPSMYLRLDDSGSTQVAANSALNDQPAMYTATGVTYRQPAAIGVGTSVGLDGVAGGIASTQAVAAPSAVSTELWVKTTSTTGGVLSDFDNGSAASVDRVLYLSPSGVLNFGTQSGGTSTVVSSAASLNDGTWHHVVATQGAAGTKLYVDGVVSASGTPTTGTTASGYWRVGGTTMGSNWPAAPTTNYLTGSVDEFAVYPAQLSASQVLAHFDAGGGNVAPTAAFTATPSAATVAFDGSGSSDADGSVASYSWNFGDNTTAGSGVAPSHTYAASGTYSVKLTVTDNKGATNSVTKQLTVTVPVNKPPVPAFTVTTTNLGLSVDGSTSSDPDGSVASYSWSWGDNSPAGNGVKATHSYASAGTYTVTLTVTDDKGATASTSQPVSVIAPPPNKPPVAAFTTSSSNLALAVDGTGSSDPDGTVAAWSWNFGDNTALGSGSRASHTYATAGTYTVTLTVTDDNGATTSLAKSVTVTAPPPVNVPPTAKWSSTTSNLTASFDGSGSTDSDGTIGSYGWNWGDNTPAGSGVKPSHTYTAAGTYTVTLTVTDNLGATNTSTGTVTVAAQPPANIPPVAAFTFTTANLVATFDGSGSSDPDGTIASYAWNWGDNTPAGSGVKPSHSYGVAGTYQVTLTVTDNKGASTSVTKAVTTAAVANVPPTAAFTSTTNNLGASFDGSGSSDPDGSIASYAWTWGDNTPAGSGLKPSHTYTAAGTYQVSLTVTDNKGATGTVNHSVTVAAAKTTYVSDKFGRTVAAGLGTADQGGSWTLLSPSSQFAVNGSVGQFKMPTAGAGPQASLTGGAARDVVETVDLTLASLPTGAGMFITNGVRVSGSSEYQSRILIQPDGTLTLYVNRIVGGAETQLTSTVLGFKLVAGTAYTLRLTAVGSGTTTLTATLWKTGTTQPSAQLSAADSTASLQSAGGYRLWTYLSSAATTGDTVTFDNLLVQAP